MSKEFKSNKHLESPYLTVPELALYTKGTKRWIYDLTSKRAIPYIKAQGKILFHKDIIDTWLLNQSVATVVAIEETQTNTIVKLKKRDKQ